MNLRIIVSICLLVTSICASAQGGSEINQTDKQGKKQGHWIKNYPNGNIMYEGVFKDDHPVGEMKRYNDDKSLKSILIYSSDGKKADASMYHPNGFLSAKGSYINQMKEGKWQFFSELLQGFLLSEEYYSANKKNGLSVKFYPDSTIAEKLTYRDDIKQGEWSQYYPSGALRMKSYYRNGKLNGMFGLWFENGTPEYSGQYKDNFRDGQWTVYKEDGTVKYQVSYVAGIAKDNQLDDAESAFLDSLENNRGKIADPEKTGIIKP